MAIVANPNPNPAMRITAYLRLATLYAPCALPRRWLSASYRCSTCLSTLPTSPRCPRTRSLPPAASSLPRCSAMSLAAPPSVPCACSSPCRPTETCSASSSPRAAWCRSWAARASCPSRASGRATAPSTPRWPASLSTGLCRSSSCLPRRRVMHTTLSSSALPVFHQINSRC